MKFVSINNKRIIKSFTEAVLLGVAEDGGLFMPENIEQNEFEFQKKKNADFKEIAVELTEYFIGNEFNVTDVIERAFYFEPEIKELNSNTFILELFQGPSLAFKDYGARFLAEVINEISLNNKRRFIVLAATSGDTGSAVARSFLAKEGIKVVLLFPSGKITQLQRKQFTTLGKNIFPLEVRGTFDDCQSLVKRAFLDNEIRREVVLISANSINIGRLIPQIYYYYYAASRLNADDLIFVVPSGNLGNLTAGLIAKRAGLKTGEFISALNVNKAFKEYLESGKIKAKNVVETISNAMDVLNPNNLERIKYLFGNNLREMNKDISAISVTDEETKRIINKVYAKSNYILDPHGATAFAAWEKFNEREKPGIILETAHPAKFIDIYEPEIAKDINIPESLKELKNKEERKIIIENGYEIFKNKLLEVAKI